MAITLQSRDSRIVFVCARCDRPVEKVEYWLDRMVRSTRFGVQCHGETEVLALPDDALDSVFGSPVFMRVFRGESSRPRVNPITPEGAAALLQAGFDADRLFAQSESKEAKQEQVKVAVEQQTVNIRTRLIRLRRE